MSQDRTQQHLYEINTEHRLSRLEATNEAILKSLDKLDKTTSEIKQSIDKLDSRIDKFDSRLWTNFYWTLTTMLGLSIGLAGIMAKGFHWF